MACVSAGVEPAITISSSSGSSVLKTFISRRHCSAVTLVNERFDKPAHTAVSLYSQEYLCGGGSTEERQRREPTSKEPR